MKRILFLVLFLSLILSFTYSKGVNNLDKSVAKKLSIASTEHDIIQLMFKKGEYDKILVELENIFSLNLPLRYEKAVLKEILIVSSELHKRGKNKLAIDVLDRGFKYCKLNEDKVIILKVKAAFLKSMGKIDGAINVFKKAVELEKEGNK